jgi:hypothetical protein
MSRYFPHNIGTADRALRTFVVAPAATIAALAIGVPSIGGIVLLAIAAIGLGTGVIGICPSYVPFGIDTHSRARRAVVPR